MPQNLILRPLASKCEVCVAQLRTLILQQIGTVHNTQQTKEILNGNGAFQESSKQEVGGACELVIPLKAADSSDTCDTSMDDDSVHAKQDGGQGTSQSVDDNSGQSEQHKEDDHPNKSGSLESDDGDGNESDSEVTYILSS